MNKPLPLPPGPLLDALIAEKVFGYPVERPERGHWSLGPPDYWDFSGDLQLANPLPAYSEDIAAAWSVVETVKAKGYRMSIDSSHHITNVTFYTLGDNPVAYSSMAKEAPHAICLAALKAVGHE